jgi:hypothetical protein
MTCEGLIHDWAVGDPVEELTPAYRFAGDALGSEVGGEEDPRCGVRR